jgi:hypothetical protein
MKRIILGTLLCSIAGCSSAEPGSSGAEAVGESKQELNGSISEKGFLIGGKFSFPIKNLDPNDPTTLVEANRQADTKNYYDTVQISATGNGPTISAGLGSLAAFKSAYGFNGGSQFVAKYYNRGDLGIGRDMHCRETTSGPIACYVTNYAAGPPNVDGTLNEFTFGFSPQIAFSNMEAANHFATVAMVYRPKAPSNKVIFMVYGADGSLANAAALDRHAVGFGSKNIGKPGVNFNSHIPTNCLNCHGGVYTRGTSSTIPTVEGGAFLPFDLDQFEYKPSSGFSRDETNFRGLNQLARQVAVGLGNSSLTDQIDAWYLNSSHAATLPANNFDGSKVVSGWQGSESIYQSVVRPSCRGCHMTSQVRFDAAADFLLKAGDIGTDIRDHTMPHALQTQRLFWQSGQPKQLADYFIANQKTQAATDVTAGSPANIVTLDPHLLSSF